MAKRNQICFLRLIAMGLIGPIACGMEKSHHQGLLSLFLLHSRSNMAHMRAGKAESTQPVRPTAASAAALGMDEPPWCAHHLLLVDNETPEAHFISSDAWLEWALFSLANLAWAQIKIQDLHPKTYILSYMRDTASPELRSKHSKTNKPYAHHRCSNFVMALLEKAMWEIPRNLDFVTKKPLALVLVPHQPPRP
ncbi:hypothetical protein PG988_008284 [Apiospora saccharicola]